MFEKNAGEVSVSSSASDPIAMMEYYMKKAAQEERIRQPKHSKDEMPPPDSLHGIHHPFPFKGNLAVLFIWKFSLIISS